MGGESPNVILYDVNGQEMSVSNGSAIPAGTSALMIAGSDGTNSRFITLDASGRTVTVGAGVAGTPAGGVVTIQGVSGGTVVPISITGTNTVTATQGTSPWVTNITQFGGSNVVTGTGASGSGIPRVTVSNDSNVLATQSGTWTVQPGNTANTTPWLFTINQGGNSATVTASNALKVDGSAVTQPVSGTVTANQGTSPWITNITQFGGTNVVTGTGTSGPGIPRVTVSNDSNILATQSGTWTVQQGTPPWAQNLTQIAGNAVSTVATGVQKVGVVGNTGSSLDATLTTGTAPTNGLGTLVQYNTSQPSPTNTQTVSLQSDQSGNLLQFHGVQNKTGTAWTSSTTINTLQYPTGTSTIGATLGAKAVLLQLDQTTTLTGGAVTIQGSYDGINWITIPVAQILNPQTFAQLTNPYTFVASTNQPFLIVLQGFQQIRINLTTLITGTGSVTPYWTILNDVSIIPLDSSGNVKVDLITPIPAGTNSIGTIILSQGGNGVSIYDNQFVVQSNTTVTTSGSLATTTNYFGVQQVNLIVNVTGPVTGTSPQIQYTIQEVDPGNGTTTMGNSAATSTINTTGVYTATLTNTTSGAIKVSWTISGTTPSFGGVYATVVSKITPTTQSTSSTNGIVFGDVTLASSASSVAVERTTYMEQTTNFTGSVVSANANDTAAGTGARTIIITYYDQTGAGPFTETATLNGTTAVNLVNTNHCFIEKINVATVGTGLSNAGIITLKTGAAGAGTTVGTINAGDNQTFWTHHYVANGKSSYVTGITLGSNSTTGGDGATYVLKAITENSSNQVELVVSDILSLYGQANAFTRNYGTPIKITGPARLRMYVQPLANASNTFRAAFDFYDQ